MTVKIDMERKTIQIIALLLLSVILTVTVSYLSQTDTSLQSNVLRQVGYRTYVPTTSTANIPVQQGYANSQNVARNRSSALVPNNSNTAVTRSLSSFAGFGYNPPPPATVPPVRTEIVNGKKQLIFTIAKNKKAVLDALLVPDHVPNQNTNVFWIKKNNASNVQIIDSQAVRTYFVSPGTPGTIDISLRVDKNGNIEEVAQYQFIVLDDMALKADLQRDGRYTFDDFLLLLQNWDQYQPDSQAMLDIILQFYQANTP